MTAFIYTISLWMALTIHSGGNTKPFQESDTYHKQITRLVENTINSGDLRSMKFLLDKGLDINYQTSPGYSILILAVMAKQRGIEKLLLENGAKIDIISPSGDTALSYAFKKGDFESMTILATEMSQRNMKSDH